MSDMFMRRCIIETGGIKLDNSNFDITFSIPFDDDLEPNVAEVTIMNLTDSTINSIKNGNIMAVTAGYGTDTGIISMAQITYTKTERDGINRKTVINTRDGADITTSQVTKKTFAKNTRASKILRTLAKSTGISIVRMTLPTDYVYKKGYTVEEKTMDEMATIANHCGASVYVSKNGLYIRSLTNGDDLSFVLESNTGLIGSPEKFTEEKEVSEEDLKYISKSRMTKKGDKYYIVTNGYKCKSLLQHKVSVGSVVMLKARGIDAMCRVKSGKHVFSSDFVTELVLLEV